MIGDDADGEKNVYTRVNMLVGDPAQLGAATSYMEEAVWPYVEARRGCRGLACLVNTDLGTCVVASYWDSLDDMTSSEDFAVASLKEVAKRLRGTLTVEHYGVPVLVRRSRPRDGACVRLIRFDCPPADIDAVVEVFRDSGVPTLLDMPGIRSAHLFADETTGRCIVATTWANIGDGQAAITWYANIAAVTHMQVRSVEEYELVFSSVRDGIALDGGMWVTPLAGFGYRSGGRDTSPGQSEWGARGSNPEPTD
jgi:heme-degrading monooxygenase HmoA